MAQSDWPRLAVSRESFPVRWRAACATAPGGDQHITGQHTDDPLADEL